MSSSSKRKERTLRPLYSNAGIEADYRKRLIALIEAMQNSIVYWLYISYRANEPEIKMAMDALPANALRKSVKQLSKQWSKRFNDMAPKLARYFATQVSRRSDKTLQRILKQGGISVEFKMTKAQRDVMRATVNANVALIRSIPQQYLHQVEGMVMRSVQEGRNLSDLSKDLKKQFGITKRRAALIARDQNNKASSALSRVRRLELGIDEAIWIHSGGGKHPRPTHVRNDGKRFNIKKGWWDPAIKRYTWPGVEIGCRCVDRPVIAGFS
jgi:SPP1 gp7 family putative phage head morphogenesis protein